MKLRIALVALAAVALIGLAACGGDDDDDTTEAATTTEATTAEEPDLGGGPASTVSLEADPGGALAYDTEALETKAGEVTIEFTNEASLGHDVRVEDADGNDLGGTEVFTEGEETAHIVLDPGEYTFYCSVPGHREGGMEGTLTVK